MRALIVGAGEVGFNIARRLIQEGADVSVVESSPERVQHCNLSLDAEVWAGSGSDPDLLLEAGIKQADLLVAVANSDEVNVVACLLASVLAPRARRVARIRNTTLSGMSELFGPRHLAVELTIHPEGLAADKIMALLAHPRAVDYVPFADGRVHAVALPMPASSPLVGMSLNQLNRSDWAKRYLLGALVRAGSVQIPRGTTRIAKGDQLYIVSSDASPAPLLELVGFPETHVKHVMIYGGTWLGATVAGRAAERGLEVKLIEPDRERCERLAGELPSTVILHGEGTDEELLRSEHVAGMDVFVACGQDEEATILSALLAKRLGCAAVILVSHKSAFFPLIESIGVRTILDPQVLAVGSVLQFVLQGRVTSVVPVGEDAAEAIEFVLPADAPVAGKALREASLPAEAIVAAVVRGEQTLIPTGDTVLEAQDRVVVFALRSAVAAVDAAMASRRSAR